MPWHQALAIRIDYRERLRSSAFQKTPGLAPEPGAESRWCFHPPPATACSDDRFNRVATDPEVAS